MTYTYIGSIFKEAFDTFKAFDNLTVQSSGSDQDEFPKSIWQILSHLLFWQGYQISCLKGAIPEKHINEVDTWLSQRVPTNEEALQEAVSQFKKQLEIIQSEVNCLPVIEEELTGKLKLIQDIALHLSFHLGEVVVIRRVKGSYPMPDQMKEFLQL